jgi:hypothetical protein
MRSGMGIPLNVTYTLGTVLYLVRYIHLQVRYIHTSRLSNPSDRKLTMITRHLYFLKRTCWN